MSTPLNFKVLLPKSGGVYGTCPSSGSHSRNSDSSVGGVVGSHHHPSIPSTSTAATTANTNTTNTTTRRRTNPTEYGPLNRSSPSPHSVSLDDPMSFPPYAELPFTAMKRRRQLQNEGTSLVKWAMRGVLLSPVIVLVLWSIIAIGFNNNNNPNHGIRNNNWNNNNNYRQHQPTQKRGVKRMLPNFMGSTNGESSQQVAYPSTVLYMQPDQQQQSDAMMMVVSPQRQQSQLQEGNGMMMVVSPQKQQQLSPLQSTNGMRMVISPQRQQSQLQDGGSGNGMRMVVSPQRRQSQGMEQVSDQQYLVVEQPQQSKQQLPIVGPLGSTQQQQSQTGFEDVVPPPQVLMVADPTHMAVQQQGQALQSMSETSTASVGPPVMTSVANVQQQQQTMDASNGNSNSNSNNDIQAVIMQQQHQQPLQQQLDTSSSSGSVVQQQSSPLKQTIYYYDPMDAALSQNGDIMRLPQVVYDANGKAVSLSQLQHVPIYVQPPLLGETLGSSSKSSSLVSSASENDSSVVQLDNTMAEEAPARGAVKIPKWGDSTSQDQTVIVATVAVMALLVGALSARRLRSKSFLASCIENETLEDDLAYDSAYTTTTTAAAGAGGAVDSSYHTFGGWRGDLEKFDV
jgi:hypothetical protein